MLDSKKLVLKLLNSELNELSLYKVEHINNPLLLF